MRIVYQFFTIDEPIVARRLDFPILLSIATLRAHHPEAEVVVLDYHRGYIDWRDFPDRLNFQVEAQEHDPAWHDGLLPIPLHRPLHAWQHARGPTVYCDSDVLWLASLPALDPEFVHMNETNTGFCAFDPARYRSAAFMGLWSSICMEAIQSQWLRDGMRLANPEPHLHDESAYLHLRRTYPELLEQWVRLLPFEVIAQPGDRPRDRTTLLHITMHQCGPRRGALAWLLRETHDAIRRVFTDQECDEIFGPSYPHGGAFSVDSIDDAIASLASNSPVLS